MQDAYTIIIFPLCRISSHIVGCLLSSESVISPTTPLLYELYGFQKNMEPLISYIIQDISNPFTLVTDDPIVHMLLFLASYDHARFTRHIACI
jgi:hypothetical protein